jgi:hypothetical protein
MATERVDYRPAWWRIGESLRDYFQVPTELPPKLLTLVRKLDAIEGNYLLLHLRGMPEQRSDQDFWLRLAQRWEEFLRIREREAAEARPPKNTRSDERYVA